MQLRGASVLALAVLIVVPLAGCSSGAVAESPSPAGQSRSTVPVTSPPPSQSPSPDPSAAAAAEVLRVYAIFMDARNKSLNDPRKPPDKRLASVSTGPARNGVLSLAVYYRSRGIAIKGAPASHPIVVKTSGDPVSRVWIDDCVDSTESPPIFVSTGKSALAPGQQRRVRVRAVANFRSSSWKISTWTPNRDESC